jgi:tripartite motif-containing protein 71
VQLWGMVGDALLRRPTGLALDADGNLYVADSGTRKVKKFNASGEFLTQWEPAVPAYTTQFLSLSRIAVDRAGRVLLIDTGPGGVEMFSRDGKFLGVGVRPTRPGGKFLGNHAVDDEGNLYLIEHGRREPWSRVRVLSSQGKELARWDADHESVGGFNEYINIAVDAAHRVFVINWRKCRIEVFSSTGVPLGRWGSCGFGPGQFGEAEAIAISATGKVYVSDYTYNRVQIFQVR